jgi:glycosyltransferase involved in cell wall biosynthesis
MKVCLVTFDFPPFSIGGIGTQALCLASYLSREGVDVHVLAAGEEYDENYVNSLFKITRLKVPFHSKLIKIPTFQFKVWRWLKKNNETFDAVHFQENAGFLYFLFDVFNKRNNTIEHFHHSHIAEFIFHLKFLFKIPMESIPYLFIPLSGFEEFLSLKKAKHVLTVSNMSRSALFSWGIDASKITVIPNAISELSFSDRGEKIPHNRAIKFLYVGRLVPRKGIDILINAVSILSKKGIDNFYVDIVGQGPLFKYCKKKIEKNDLKNCNMWGLIPQQKLDELYREADCFICPSRLEGFGIVLLEAAANNLAIIANDIPVFKEIYSNDEVLYFKQNYPDDLAQKMINLCLHPNKIKLLQGKARDKVKNYSWSMVVHRYVDVYKQVVNK